MSVFGLLSIFPFLLYLVFFGFIIYFMIKVLQFMKERTMLEKERNAKLYQLVKAVEKLTRQDDERRN